jgi:hypothetical protein
MQANASGDMLMVMVMIMSSEVHMAWILVGTRTLVLLIILLVN